MDRHRLYLCFGGLPRPLLSRVRAHTCYTRIKMYTWNGSDCLVKKQAFGGDLKSCKFYILLANTPSSTAGNCFVIIFTLINIKKRNACFCVCIDFYPKQRIKRVKKFALKEFWIRFESSCFRGLGGILHNGMNRYKLHSQPFYLASLHKFA